MSEPAERWADEMADDVRRETYALGLSAPAEIHAAIAALAAEFDYVLPGLSDPFFATYVAGVYRYGARHRGKSDDETAAGIWSAAEVARQGDTGVRAIAGEILAIEKAIEGIRPFRDELERPRNR